MVRTATMRMSITGTKPLFCVVLGDGDLWSVEAEWPDGTIEQVKTFKRYSEAAEWVKVRSKAWLDTRLLPASQSRLDQRSV
jgi:hypothetical protein